LPAWRRRPGIGHHWRDLADVRYRFWTVYSYVIAYREANPLEIVVVVHGARHLEACRTGSPIFPRPMSEPSRRFVAPAAAPSRP
jgi:hypothetical protein